MAVLWAGETGVGVARGDGRTWLVRQSRFQETLYSSYVDVGRAWTVEELRYKSWNDLHSLWWVCVKERNRIKTQTYELLRLAAGYGEFEAGARDDTVCSRLPPLLDSIPGYSRRIRLQPGRRSRILKR